MNSRIRVVVFNNTEYEVRAVKYEVRTVKKGDLYKAAVWCAGIRLSEDIFLSTEAVDDTQLYAGRKTLDFLFRALENEIRAGRIRA